MKNHTILASVAAAAALLLAAPLTAFGDDLVYADAGITTFTTMRTISDSVWVGNSNKDVFANDWHIWRSSDGSLSNGITQTVWKNMRIADFADNGGRLRVESGLYHAMNDIIVGVGSNSVAHLMVSGGRMESAWWMKLADGENAIASAEVNTNGVLYVGTDDPDRAGGGSVMQLGLGVNSISSLTVKDSGEFLCNELQMAGGEGATATCTISGGTLTAAHITEGAGTATININGGELVASTDGTFIADNIDCVVGGDAVISTTNVVTILSAFTGSGTIIIDVKASGGKVTMPEPANAGVKLEPSDTTKVSEDGNGNLVFEYALFVWSDNDTRPSDGDNVIIPEGASVTNLGTLALASLRINGSLTQGDIDHATSSLTATKILSDTGTGKLNLNWGTLAATAAGTFISEGVACIVGGNPTISTASPITIAPTLSAPDGGTVTVIITGDDGDNDGCVIMHTPSSLSVRAGAGTQSWSRNGWSSFYPNSEDITIWYDAANTPTNNATAIIPAGYEINFSPTETITLESLRIDGKLTINQGSNQYYHLLTGDNDLTTTGTGTLAFPSSAWSLYNEKHVNTDDSLTLLIQRSIAEAKNIYDGEPLLQIAAGSQISGPVKLANSRRPLVISYDTSYIEYKAGAIPPSWTKTLETAGQIVWDDAKTISDDSDISTEGVFVSGCYHVYGNPSSQTIGDISLRRLYGSNDAPYVPISFSTISGSTTNNYNIFDNKVRQTGLDLSFLTNASSEYKHILSGGFRCNYGAAGGYMDITISGLTKGHAYLIQLFCMDPTKTTGAAAKMYVGPTKSNGSADITDDDKLVLTNVNAADGTAGPGQYIIGRFVAAGDSQTFRIKGGSGYGRQNAILWRDITADVVWGGGENNINGAWDNTGVNWVNYAAEDQIWKNDVIGYVYGAVVSTNANVTVTNGAPVYAASLELSGGASVTVASRAHLWINNDITATSDAKFTIANGGNVHMDNGSLRMSGHGTFEVEAQSLTKVVIDAGQLMRKGSANSTTLEFSGTALYGDETAKENGYHAQYVATGDITLNSLSGNGNITADNGTLAINDSSNTERVFTGHIKADKMVKLGHGTLKLIGESEVKSVTVSYGTLALATPADLSGFNYDLDAMQTDSLTTQTDGNGNTLVTSWADATTGNFVFTTNEVDFTYYGGSSPRQVVRNSISPTLTTSDDIFGGRQALVSEKFRMVSSATKETQKTVFAVVQFLDEAITNLVRTIEDEDDKSYEYRWNVRVSTNGPSAFLQGKNDATRDTFISVNGVYGGGVTSNVPAVLTVPFQWTRSDKGLRHVTYGSGTPMAWGEVVSYDRELSVEEKKAVEEFLMRKWGIGEERVYAPFGTNATLKVDSGATFDAGAQAMTIGSITVQGDFKGVSNITTKKIEFMSGAKIYIERSDVANGFMNVAEEPTGLANATIYFSDGTHASGYALTYDAETHKLKPNKAGFSVRLR